MRTKVQGPIMQARFIEIQQVFEKKEWSDTFLTDLVKITLISLLYSERCFTQFSSLKFIIKCTLNMLIAFLEN